MEDAPGMEHSSNGFCRTDVRMDGHAINTTDDKKRSG